MSTMNQGVMPAPAVRIGFPRAMLYYKYAAKWKYFFEHLGCKVIVSPKTNRGILEKGTRNAIDENCLAVKVYLGHVEYLLDKVDYIFVPRLESLHKNESACVKMFGLGDVVRNTFDNVKVLECDIAVKYGIYEFQSMFQLAMQFTRNPLKALQVYWNASRIQKEEHRRKIDEQEQRVKGFNDGTCRILLVSHSYITHDALMGMPIVKMLQEQNVEIVYADWIDETAGRALSTQISTDIYWTYNKELLGAIAKYREEVDGIIFLMAFPCGPDSLAINLCQNTITGIPMAVLVLDELLGDAGLKTRIESFVDILRFKKEKAS